jgi:copper chaperone CopZ
MTHTYQITGMTCTGCQAKVQSLLKQVHGVTDVIVDLENKQATVTMAQHIPTIKLQAALADHPKYALTEVAHHEDSTPSNSIAGEEEIGRSFWQTYKPVLLIFIYLLTLSVLTTITSGTGWMNAMRIFMAGFFLTFSFFKILNLSGFADSYATYDIIAKKFRGWGYVYAFIELALGLAYAVNFYPAITNAVTLAVMSISIIGVLQSVLNKRKIKCACLGDVFNLPMSTVTIIEDAHMIVMSALMLILL